MLKIFLALTAFIGRTIIRLVEKAVILLSTSHLYLNNKFRQIKRPVVSKKSLLSKKGKKELSTRALNDKSLLYRGFLYGFFICLVSVLLPSILFMWFSALPSPKGIVNLKPPRSTEILDYKGRLLYEIYKDKKSEPILLSKIPPHFINAIVAVEDAEFYNHSGIDLKGTTRALYKSFTSDNLQGGSTITQQLVKNVLLTPERTISRKIKEAVLSIMVEKRYTKDQILEMYLNNVSFGGVAIGVQTAAQKYFGKDVSELDIAESALLAGLPGAPTSYSPFLDYSAAKERQLYVLERMVSEGYLTEDQLSYEYSKDIKLATENVYIRAPHFVTYVIDQLTKSYGERFLSRGGMKIYTSLDLDLQDEVSTIVQEEIEKSGGKFLIGNGAALIVDVKNSSILAYAGSVDYFKDSWGSYDVVRARRQPGSSIKPITYSLALSKGYSAATIISDSPVRYSTKGSPDYVPVNYDGRFHGDVTLRKALANSYNIPAVKLAAALGPANILDLGQKMGIDSWSSDTDYGLSITLGGEEVSLLELTNVYATLARGGIKKNLHSVSRIEQEDGQILYSYNDIDGERALSEEVSYIISHILSDNNARIPAFGTNNDLKIPGFNVAVKTGTTDNKRDNWTFGYTPSFAVGVWVGNNDNTMMNKNLASGLSGASPIWNRITTYILKNTNYYANDFNMPANVYVLVDANCGGKTEIFIKNSKPPLSLCNSSKKGENAVIKRAENQEKDNRHSF